MHRQTAPGILRTSQNTPFIRPIRTTWLRGCGRLSRGVTLIRVGCHLKRVTGARADHAPPQAQPVVW